MLYRWPRQWWTDCTLAHSMWTSVQMQMWPFFTSIKLIRVFIESFALCEIHQVCHFCRKTSFFIHEQSIASDYSNPSNKAWLASYTNILTATIEAFSAHLTYVCLYSKCKATGKKWGHATTNLDSFSAGFHKRIIFAWFSSFFSSFHHYDSFLFLLFSLQKTEITFSFAEKHPIPNPLLFLTFPRIYCS